MRSKRLYRAAVAAFTCCFLAANDVAAAGYTLKTANTPPPKELKEPIRGLLAPQSFQIVDGKGELYCEVWLRKSIPAKGSPEQVKNGLTYRETEETTIYGAIRYAQAAEDYRRQTINPGVYTLRLGFQPQDGDHMGTAPHPDFCLLISAENDERSDTMDVKAAQEASAKSLGSNHPGVLLLFPNEKPEPTAKLADQGMGHWVLRVAAQANVAGKSAPLGLALAVVGHSEGA